MLFLNEVEVLAFKAPSFIKNLDTGKIIKTLWGSKISPNADEDKTIKKLIANVNFGLMEKSTNKVQCSKMYESLDVAKFHQQKYGGKISILTKYHEEFEVNPLDFGEEDVEETRTWKQDEKKYYILNVSDKAHMRNGFRYIKELLLQYHNFKISY